MKQINVFSRLLAALFLAGSLALPAFAFQDDDKIQYQEAVDAVVELNIMGGRESGTFDPTDLVTRAEMARMTVMLISGGVEPTLEAPASPIFDDTGDHWAEAYIAYCSGLGIIAGMGDGSFLPDDPVTGVQAAKMLLVCLGYNAYADALSGTSNWTVNVNVRANLHGFYDGLTNFYPNKHLSREEAALIIYNALNAEMVRPEGGSGGATIADTELPTPTTAEVGEVLKTQWFDFSVDAFELVADYEGQTPDRGNLYLVTTVTEKNTWSGRADIPMSDADFMLYLNGDETKYLYCEDPWAPSMMPGYFVLKPGESATYDLVFELPTDTETVSFLYIEIDESDAIHDTFTVELLLTP